MPTAPSRTSTWQLALFVLLALAAAGNAQPLPGQGRNEAATQPRRTATATPEELERAVKSRLAAEKRRALQEALEKAAKELRAEIEREQAEKLREERALSSLARPPSSVPPGGDPRAEEELRARLKREADVAFERRWPPVETRTRARVDREFARRLRAALERLREERATRPLPRDEDPPWTPDPRLVRSLGAFSRVRVPKPRLVIEGAWGAAPGQFGEVAANESNPEAPMSLHLTAENEILVLDQANRRIQRFGQHGALLSTHPIDTSATQDLTTDHEGRILALARFGKPGVQVFDPNGQPARHLRIVGEGLVSDGGGITGLIADASGIYVEWAHDDLVAVADADGSETTVSRTIPGRPTRDGLLYIKAGIIDARTGELYVQAHRRARTPEGRYELAWERRVDLQVPLLQLLMLDSDAQGRILVAAETSDSAATVVVRLAPDGEIEGPIAVLPPTSSHPHEVFRPLALAHDGTLYQMISGPEGVRVSAFRF